MLIVRNFRFLLRTSLSRVNLTENQINCVPALVLICNNSTNKSDSTTSKSKVFYNFSSGTSRDLLGSENKLDKMISFDSYDAVGFDCDHTLAQYNLYHLFKDSYDDMAKYLVKKKKYKKEIFQFDPRFCSRGVILDLESGNFLKLAHDGSILRLFHGTSPLPRCNYDCKVWPLHQQLSTSMDNLGTKFRIFENFYDMSSALLCAQLIDELDRRYSSNPPSYNVWPDVVEAIRHVYIPNPLKAEYGSFFDKWVKDTSRYVRKCSTSMKSWLRMMRHNNGKTRPMFLLTSAYQDFAEATLEFVLGERWEEFFDFSIFHAEKPMFFNKKNPFYSTFDCNTKVVADQLEGNRKVLGGNFTQLDKHLQLVTGKQNPKVLFFGDSLRSDIIPAKRTAKWDTVFILEEMISEQCFYKRSQDKFQAQCRQDMPWGSIFIDGEENDVIKETMLHYVIRIHADIAIPSLQLLLDYPLDYKFKTFNAFNHLSTSGFQPSIPEAFRRMYRRNTFI